MSRSMRLHLTLIAAASVCASSLTAAQIAPDPGGPLLEFTYGGSN